ncbi:MAG: class I SAM-dependent DNA methyltransferase [Candidatus Spyradenecus sp.]
MAKSVEELVEDRAKRWLDDCQVSYYAKNEELNAEIGAALREFPSKKGGQGGNFPDIQVMIEPIKGLYLPVMIEVKGSPGALVKRDEAGRMVLETHKANGEWDWATIQRYALNGAIHYATAILYGSRSYDKVLAVGVNGWKEASGALKTELAVYYLSKDNLLIPKRVADYSDLSFLRGDYLPELVERIESINLTESEREAKANEIENLIEIRLKELNQPMQDELQISENMRVSLVAGMIMAGLGVEGKVSPLEIVELKGDLGRQTHDGAVIMNRIRAFLEEKELPPEKREVVLTNTLATTFLGTDALYKPRNGESPLKRVYTFIQKQILPYFTSKHHLDFTGRLFNVLNAWVKVPDGAENDVVLTPRYVTDLMARLAGVNKDSYVWDYALGSAGFLISAMKLMLLDAKAKIKSPDELRRKELQIKHEQLLGIEKLPDVYLLAVLNMILMQDGSANILNEDSLKHFDGAYQQGARKGQPFPADVFLLNPPYSTEGKGFIFVERALSRMRHGRAAVLIQENAGSGNGLPYTKRILERNTLLASIHMADIFKGKAGVQTAIYLFEVGKPHNIKQRVRFIDFTEDGYARQNRKKSSLNVNLRDVDHAKERYEEVVNLVLYGGAYRHYLAPEAFFEDTISLAGDDWTVQQHRKVDTAAKPEDFERVVAEYLSWKVSTLLKSEGPLGKPPARG